MKLYDAPASNPMAVRLFVLERRGISLDVETIDVMNMENRGLEYRKINPRGEVPALVLENGIVLSEVTAICEYHGYFERMDVREASEKALEVFRARVEAQ
ncbi:Glutathione S-transferase domain containing protein [Fusarium agapanthi]|uniref:Glutathione S-transferase domain containing protein n=1 Tax=Fusarium agapanthi TaxID=1803897 RepID=A0A9P5AXR3_9HYPO|nr:Glutathione S-transferase domain containing protein [Fusarium agapanthi]